MTRYVSILARDAVLAALPGPESPGVPPRDVAPLLTGYTPSTVRHALVALVADGKVERSGCYSNYRYRRAARPQT